MWWCNRLRSWPQHPLVVVLGFVCAAGMLLQLKALYDNHQKLGRIREYEHGAEQLTDTMEHIDAVGDKLVRMRYQVEQFVGATAAQQRQDDANATAADR